LLGQTDYPDVTISLNMMKLGRLIAIVWASVWWTVPAIRADASSPTITSVTVANGQISLTWQDGRPTYQVQSRPALGQAWTNIGNQGTNTSAQFSISGNQAFYRVVSDYTAQYQVVFDATWSQATHPSNWPASPHFSGLVGGTHKPEAHFYRLGETSSEGIRLMAEQGSKTTLLNEVSDAIGTGTAHLQLSGGGISTSPGSVRLTFSQPMRRDYPLVTLVSMIAPSPDWFVGVDSLNLIQDGQWATNMVVTLYGMDAGTDSGESYQSPDQNTDPRDGVTEFTGFPALVNGVIVPFGTYTFTRQD